MEKQMLWALKKYILCANKAQLEQKPAKHKDSTANWNTAISKDMYLDCDL
jgi:ferritin-like metal-binding protein YciE